MLQTPPPNISKNSRRQTTILYYDNVDIDGFAVRSALAKLVAETGHKKHYQRAHEWCCGHGAIGFELLEQGLCDHLVLTDKFGPATQGCCFTVAANDLQSQVTVYTSDSLGDLPADEKWDLFVANPPWRPTVEHGNFHDDHIRKGYDLGWATHRNMWQHLYNYTTDDADIYLYEDTSGSTVETWQEDIQRSGFRLQGVEEKFGILSTGYVMHLVKS